MPRAHAQLASIIEQVSAVRDNMQTLRRTLEQVSRLVRFMFVCPTVNYRLRVQTHLVPSKIRQMTKNNEYGRYNLTF